MLRIREYRRAESLEEAYELNQKKTNHILAGGVWTKMGDRNWMCAIDLSGLGLDKIEETDEEFIIGWECSSATVPPSEAAFSAASAFLMS